MDSLRLLQVEQNQMASLIAGEQVQVVAAPGNHLDARDLLDVIRWRLQRLNFTSSCEIDDGYVG